MREIIPILNKIIREEVELNELKIDSMAAQLTPAQVLELAEKYKEYDNYSTVMMILLACRELSAKLTSHDLLKILFNSSIRFGFSFRLFKYILASKELRDKIDSDSLGKILFFKGRIIDILPIAHDIGKYEDLCVKILPVDALMFFKHALLRRNFINSPAIRETWLRGAKQVISAEKDEKKRISKIKELLGDLNDFYKDRLEWAEAPHREVKNIKKLARIDMLTLIKKSGQSEIQQNNLINYIFEDKNFVIHYHAVLSQNVVKFFKLTTKTAKQFRDEASTLNITASEQLIISTGTELSMELKNLTF